MSIEALVSLRSAGASPIGRDRIRLLEAVARSGSITAAARTVGLSYKAAWSALEAMSNLFGQPLLEARAGGPSGGGATLTPAGQQALRAFHRLEGELQRSFRAIAADLEGSGIHPLSLVTGYLMRTSARNALRGTITGIAADAISSEVAIAIDAGTTIFALVTNESARELGLAAGREAIVLIKAPFVIIAAGEARPATSMRNCLRGTVVRCEMSALMAEVVLEIADGKTLAATISAASAKALALTPGRAAFALFDAAHAIVAID